jgi:hypothetical protein
MELPNVIQSLRSTALHKLCLRRILLFDRRLLERSQ